MDVSPSILSADFLNLGDDINFLNQQKIESIHIDVMDGYFVENVTWGVSTIKLINDLSKVPLDIHLLINEPERKLKKYLDMQPKSIYIHPESTQFMRKNLLAIKKQGVIAGAALKLETPVAVLENCVDLLDGVLLLSCDEGFGGNAFNELTLKKVEQVKNMFSRKTDLEIIIDGGINNVTAKLIREVGATKVVSGSYLFSDRENFGKKIETLK